MPLTRQKENKPDSAGCFVFFPPLSFPLNLVIILHRAERKPSVAGESILTRQLSKPLRTGGQRRRAASPAEASPPWLLRGRYSCRATAHCTQESLQHARAHLYGWFYCHGNRWLIPWVMPWEGILMTESQQRSVEDGERWRGGWENC